MSPLASPAGVAHTPVAAPVGSGQAGFFGSSLVPVKYAGSFGAGACAAAGASAFAGSPGALASCANDVAVKNSKVPNPTAKPKCRYFRSVVSIVSSKFILSELDCILALFPRADADDFFHWRDKDLAVADFAGLRAIGDHLN